MFRPTRVLHLALNFSALGCSALVPSALDRNALDRNAATDVLVVSVK